ncbi:MAG: alpha/beta fold hydrolase [Deltaproteobacteria bacterium]|nr:alpha/beta fold hydrolase [Deltaproteobacteria bacterium]
MNISKERVVNVRDDIELCVQTFGDDEHPPLLLVCGIGSQMLSWPQAFCEELAAVGHFVIRFDNRDVGRSTWMHGEKAPPPKELASKLKEGIDVDVPYLLSDMADDAAALLDELGLQSVHVVGISMGGMIAQTFAIHHRHRCRSLTSIMSTTSKIGLPPPKRHAIAALLIPAPDNRDGSIERGLVVMRAIGSPDEHFDDELVRSLAGQSYDRSDDNPEGFARQFAAILASGSRREQLEDLKIKALVIHGAEDPLLPLECGEDTSDALLGSELVVIEGMGHDLPRKFWPRITTPIVKVVASGERQRQWREDFA